MIYKEMVQRSIFKSNGIFFIRRFYSKFQLNHQFVEIRGIKYFYLIGHKDDNQNETH